MADQGFVLSLSAVGGNFSRILHSSHSGIYVLLIAMMSMFLLSCEVENISKEDDTKIEIPVKEDYLAFSTFDQFTKFLQSPDDYVTPQSFHSLSSKLSLLTKDYLKDGSHSAELQDYYLLTEGRVPRPEYKYFSFMGGLNGDQMVQIDGKLYKFDFDEVKLAIHGEISDFDSESTFTVEYSQVERRFYQKPTRAILDVDCGYAFADLIQLYGSIFASLNIQSLYPIRAGYTIFQMWPDPNGNDDIGTTISYSPSYSQSIDWETYSCPASYEGQPNWSVIIMSIPAPCSPKEITLDLPYTRANWLGALGPLDECEGLVRLLGLSKQFYGCN